MTLYSTMWQDEPGSVFADGLVVLRRDRQSQRSIASVLWRCEDGDAVLLNGAMGFGALYVDLLLALMIRLRRRRVALVVSDATWHARSTPTEARVPALHGLVERWGKLLLRLLRGPYVHFCFLSAAEVASFVEQAPADPANVHFTRFSPSILSQDLPALRAMVALPRPPEHRYVFSGGNSSRDYPLLIEALAQAPYEVRVACSAALPWPPNFRAGPVPHEDFMRTMAGSAVVVLPLDARTERGVGQQSYLNAMVLGLPVVVTDAVGVRDYLEDGVDAVIVPPGDPAALRGAVDRLLDPANAQETVRLADRGRVTADALSRDRYFQDLKAVLLAAQREVAGT